MAESAHEIANLRRLLDVTRRMAATTSLTELLQTIIDATCAVLECERATIFLYNKSTNELCSSVATGVESISFPADRGIAGAAASRRQIINVPDAYADPRFNPDVDKKTGFRTRNLLTFPLENLDGDLTGVLQALNKRGGPFLAPDEELARVLSAQAGVALHRQKLLEEYADKQRMKHDLDLARQIQRAALPKQNPQVEGYEIAGWNQSAEETGGDCFDFMPLEDGRLTLMLADATGHGIGAALVIAQWRALTRGMLSVTRVLQTVAKRVNDILDQDLTDDRFVTAFIGLLDPKRHCLEYVAAGQGPLLFVSPTHAELRPASGLPFAISDGFEWPATQYELPVGMTAVLLTDGFYETVNPEGEMYGEDRVIRFFQQHANTPLDTLIRKLHAELRIFSHNAPQADDLTAVLVRRNG